MEHHISILFYVWKSEKTTDGLLLVYIRITINGRSRPQKPRSSQGSRRRFQP